MLRLRPRDVRVERVGVGRRHRGHVGRHQSRQIGAPNAERNNNSLARRVGSRRPSRPTSHACAPSRSISRGRRRRYRARRASARRMVHSIPPALSATFSSQSRCSMRAHTSTAKRRFSSANLRRHRCTWRAKRGMRTSPQHYSLREPTFTAAVTTGARRCTSLPTQSCGARAERK